VHRGLPPFEPVEELELGRAVRAALDVEDHQVYAVGGLLGVHR
jgi:hypothetical protein